MQNGITIWPCNPIPGIYLENILIQKDIYIPMLIAALNT